MNVKELDETMGDVKPDQPPASQPRRRRKRTPSRTSLEGPLKAEFLFFGHMFSAVDPTCGGAVIAQAGELAKALNTVAQDDPKVYRWLKAVSSVGGWGGVGIAVLPVVQAVTVHHVLPAVQRRRDMVSRETYEEPGDGQVRIEEESEEAPGGPVRNPNELAT